MKKNQKGFTFIEVMLVLIFATLISFVGWYVWDHQKSDTAKSNNSSNANKSGSDVSYYKTFSHKELSFTFRYPPNWTTLDKTTDYGFYSLRLRAPGTVVESNMGEDIKSGAQILFIRDRVTTIDSIEKFANEGPLAQYLTDKKTTAVDGIAMLSYENGSADSGGTNLHGVQFYKDSVEYSFTLDSDKYTSKEYGKVFDSIIESIKFN